MKCERTQKFRQETDQMLGKAKDATFELMDSVLKDTATHIMTTIKAHSSPHLMPVVWRNFLYHLCLEENGQVPMKLCKIAVRIEIN